MVAVPTETPVTIPVIGCTLATPGVLLVHTPLGVALVYGVVVPMHTLAEPLIAAGSGFTVTVVVTKQDPPVE